MALFFDDTRSISVTDANARGVSGLLRDAENGSDVIVKRHGHPVAAVVSVARLAEISNLEADVRSAALVLARSAADDGSRTDLDEIIASLGFDRGQLEAELNGELVEES